MNVLVINCGSSSLKYQLIDSETENVLAKGLCERIGIDGRLVYQKAGCDKEITEAAMPTHKEAIQMVLDALTNDKTGAIGSLKEVNAIDVLCYGIAKFVGGYVAAMNGVDAIVFTAGIGENAIPVREKVVSYLGYLGVTLDKDANGHRGEEIVISTPDSKVKVAVIPTNEELAICRETVALV